MAARVQTEDIDVGAELAALDGGTGTVGGITSFVGLVRGGPGAADPVSALTLEHYPGMAERRLATLEAAARERWPLERVLIVHRVGRLAPGERIVLVAVASAHREAAFEACRFLVDWLKTRAPFWKSEARPDGERWVEAHPEDDAAAGRWE